MRVLEERRRGQLQNPRRNDSSPPPNLRDVSEIHVVSIVLGIAQWRSFRVGRFACLFAGISPTQNRDSLRVCRHDAILDSVVHHLDEMTGAIWAAVQVTLLGRTVDLLPADGAGNIADSRSESSEERI